jgi:NAD(P)-dependent dehydrogenase (short-subunit alcohol dehydrogenase family)
MAQELEGKVALVSGGGRGLGEAICRTLASAGTIVVSADVRKDLAETVAEGIEEAGGCAFPLQVDVSDETQARDAVSETVRRFARLDFLVNNAAVDATLPIDELPVCEWDRILAVNLRGPFLMSKFAVEQMRRQRSGHIVSIASTASKRAWANASAYHASKWGLLGFTHALHAELRAYGIKTTAVVAGGMRTPFLLDRFPDIDPEVLQDPRNVAETVRFVLSQPAETVVPEVMVIPIRETSWP